MLRASVKAGHKRIMLKAPVAFGKTLVAAVISRNTNDRRKSVWFVCDSITLIDQTVESFYAEGCYDIGVIQADHPMTNFTKHLQICSVQTIQRRPVLPAIPNVMLIDEAHCKSTWLLELLERPEWANVLVIGLSATPWAKGLGNTYTDLIMPCSMKDLIATINPDSGKPYMSPYRIFSPGYIDGMEAKVRKLKTKMTRMGMDYDENGQAEILGTDELVADIVETWKAQAEGRATLAFCVDRAHAAKIQARFLQAGIGWGYIDGFTERHERKEIKRQLDAGEIKGVSSVDAMVKGIDWAFGALIWARFTKSKMLLVQGDGRGLRMNQWDDLLIFDHAGNHNRLGFPCDIDALITTLDTSKPGEKSETQPDVKPEALPKECPKCHFLKPPKVRECPQCSFVPTKESKIEERDGVLVEQRSRVVEMENFYRGALFYARSKGKQDGWAWHLTQEKFGTAPRNTSSLSPVKPTPEVLGFIQHRNIRRAKGRKAA